MMFNKIKIISFFKIQSNMGIIIHAFEEIKHFDNWEECLYIWENGYFTSLVYSLYLKSKKYNMVLFSLNPIKYIKKDKKK